MNAVPPRSRGEQGWAVPPGGEGAAPVRRAGQPRPARGGPAGRTRSLRPSPRAVGAFAPSSRQGNAKGTFCLSGRLAAQRGLRGQRPGLAPQPVSRGRDGAAAATAAAPRAGGAPRPERGSHLGGHARGGDAIFLTAPCRAFRSAVPRAFSRRRSGSDGTTKPKKTGPGCKRLPAWCE